MQQLLFEPANDNRFRHEALGNGAVILRNFAFPMEKELLDALHTVMAHAPFRHMVTPNGYNMSVAMTNCGALGWTTDRTGYRYTTIDPETGVAWPVMPHCFRTLAIAAAEQAGYSDFKPESCLINRYVPGSKLSLHQDKDEQDRQSPIVSVSLGLPAIFLFGGQTRNAMTTRIPLLHTDVIVWGGESRLFYHGIAPVKPGSHPILGECRINLTFRKVLSGSVKVE